MVVVLGLPIAVMAVLGRSLLALGTVPGAVDHPSQFARMLWFREAMAAGRDPLGFTFAFGGGTPDLQLYPPGVASFGWLLSDVVRLGPERGYWLVVVVAWFLPAVAAAATMRWVGGKVSTAALAGVVVGTLSFGYSGTRGGAAIGVLGSRISLGAWVLLVGLLVRESRRPADADVGQDVGQDVGREVRKRIGRVVPIAVTAFTVAWFHGFFLPATLFTLVALWWFDRKAQKSVGIGAAFGGLLIAGWWWAGALAAREAAVPIDRAAGAAPSSFLLNPAFGTFGGVDWLVLVAGAGLAVAGWFRRSGRPLEGLAVLAVPLLASLAAFAVSLVDQAIGSGQLDPSRVVDGVYVWVAMAAVASVERVPAPIARTWATAAVAAVIGVAWFGMQAKALPPSAFADRLDTIEARGPHQLWGLLRQGSGRVLFTASSFEDASAIPSLTYARTGREPTLGGRLQASVQHGPNATTLVGNATDFDNLSLFGFSWSELRDDEAARRQIHAWMLDLRVTTVVAERRAAANPTVSPSVVPEPADVLALSPGLFRPMGRAGPLDVFEVVGADSAVVVGDRIRLPGESAGSWQVKAAAVPAVLGDPDAFGQPNVIDAGDFARRGATSESIEIITGSAFPADVVRFLTALFGVALVLSMAVRRVFRVGSIRSARWDVHVD